MKPKTKLKALQAGGFLTTFAPLSVGVGINWQDYFKTTSSAVSLSMGGALAMAIIIIQLAGKGKAIFGNAFFVSGVIFALMILLEPIILNLKFLTGMMFAGEAGYALIFKPQIESQKKAVDFSGQADALKETIKEVIRANGRV